MDKERFLWYVNTLLDGDYIITDPYNYEDFLKTLKNCDETILSKENKKILLDKGKSKVEEGNDPFFPIIVKMWLE